MKLIFETVVATALEVGAATVLEVVVATVVTAEEEVKAVGLPSFGHTGHSHNSCPSLDFIHAKLENINKLEI